MIDALTGQGINVRHACRTLRVSESGYYAWKDRPTSPRELRRIWLAGEIVDVQKASGGTYGATRVRAELIHGRGIHVGHGAVELIMRRLGIKGLPTRRLPRGARLAKITSLDLVGRQFRRAELRREHFVRGMSIMELVRRTGLSRNTVRAALRSPAAPSYSRQPTGLKRIRLRARSICFSGAIRRCPGSASGS